MICFKIRLLVGCAEKNWGNFVGLTCAWASAPRVGGVFLWPLPFFFGFDVAWGKWGDYRGFKEMSMDVSQWVVCFYFSSVGRFPPACRERVLLHPSFPGFSFHFPFQRARVCPRGEGI